MCHRCAAGLIDWSFGNCFHSRVDVTGMRGGKTQCQLQGVRKTATSRTFFQTVGEPNGSKLEEVSCSCTSSDPRLFGHLVIASIQERTSPTRHAVTRDASFRGWGKLPSRTLRQRVWELNGRRPVGLLSVRTSSASLMKPLSGKASKARGVDDRVALSLGWSGTDFIDYLASCSQVAPTALAWRRWYLKIQ